MQVTLKMWTPKGTMAEFAYDEGAPEGVAESAWIQEVEAYWLQAGFTSQRPDHTYPVKEQVIEGIVVVETNTPDKGGTQRVLYLYTDNPKLEYAEYSVYPEDPWYPKLATRLDMNNVISGQPPRKGDMHTPVNSKAWQPIGAKATFVPARNKEGQLIFRKKKNSDERKEWPEYKVQSVEGFSQAPTNGNHAATNGAQGTRNAGATPDATWSYPDLLEWAVDSGACDNEFEAKNSLKKLVRELFKLAAGQEGTFFPNATPDKHETLKNNYILHQQEKLDERMMHVVAANNLDDMSEGEELPF